MTMLSFSVCGKDKKRYLCRRFTRTLPRYSFGRSRESKEGLTANMVRERVTEEEKKRIRERDGRGKRKKRSGTVA